MVVRLENAYHEEGVEEAKKKIRRWRLSYECNHDITTGEFFFFCFKYKN